MLVEWGLVGGSNSQLDILLLNEFVSLQVSLCVLKNSFLGIPNI